MPFIITVAVNLEESSHQLKGDKHYVSGHTDCKTSSEVTDLA